MTFPRVSERSERSERVERTGVKRSAAERVSGADEHGGVSERANEWPIFHRVVSDRSIPPCNGQIDRHALSWRCQDASKNVNLFVIWVVINRNGCDEF